MRFTISREAFLKPLQMVSGAVEKKQTLPILSNVLISLCGQQLSIVGTDLEVELVARLVLDRDKVDSKDELVETTVSARKLMDICRSLPDDAVMEVVTEKDRLVLRSLKHKSHFTLLTLPASEFPSVGQDEEAKHKDKDKAHLSPLSFMIKQKALKDLIEKTHFSMAHQDVRYFLNGMLFELNQGVIKTVATDGHRLAMASIKNIALKGHKNIIVPRKGVLELVRLLDEVDTEIKITISNNHIHASTQEFTFTSKLIDGQFPAYERVIPKGGDKTATINRELLKQSLIRASILSNEKFRGVRLYFTKGLLKLSANNPEQEEAEEELLIDYDNADLEIAFNVTYLIDVCNTIETENLKLILSDSDSSLLIEEMKGEGEVAESGDGSKEVDNTENLYVVMPMLL